tara:strand:- start:165 stop:374 length:210 start_codon:yes stop_codon:yes gene_type:complete
MIPIAIAKSIGPMIPSNVMIAMSIPLPALLFGSPKQVAHAISSSADVYMLEIIMYLKYFILYGLEFFHY